MFLENWQATAKDRNAYASKGENEDLFVFRALYDQPRIPYAPRASYVVSLFSADAGGKKAIMLSHPDKGHVCECVDAPLAIRLEQAAWVCGK